MTNVLLKRSSLDTDMRTGRIPSEHEDRIWDDVSVSQRTLINHQNLGEQHGTDFFPHSFQNKPTVDLRLIVRQRISVV